MPTTTRTTSLPPLGCATSSAPGSSRRAKSTPVQLSMFDLPISSASANATSSLALESGATACVSPAGLTRAPAGPAVVHAGLSARSAAEKGLLTSGTFGPLSIISSNSASLALSLENRLRARTALLGSTLFNLTWKSRATPSQRSISALRALARPTSDNDCTGWLTPSARDWKDSAGMATSRPDGRSRIDQLPRQAQLARSGTMQTGLGAQISAAALLNPAHSRWLMGLPPAWDDCAPTEMRSSRRSRPSSSKQQWR